MIIVMLEGVDRTGKTTLQRRLNKATNFSFMIIDRSYLTHTVYNEVYNRGVSEETYKKIEDMFLNLNSALIYLYADAEIINKRLEEEHVEELTDYKLVQNVVRDLDIYKKHYNKCKFRKIAIDTGVNDLDEVFELALNFLKSL